VPGDIFRDDDLQVLCYSAYIPVQRICVMCVLAGAHKMFRIAINMLFELLFARVLASGDSSLDMSVSGPLV
jgi:hypothetical protein